MCLGHRNLTSVTHGPSLLYTTYMAKKLPAKQLAAALHALVLSGCQGHIAMADRHSRCAAMAAHQVMLSALVPSCAIQFSSRAAAGQFEPEASS